MRKHKVHSSIGLFIVFLVSIAVLGIFVYLLTDTVKDTSVVAPEGFSKLKEVRQELDTPPPVAP